METIYDVSKKLHRALRGRESQPVVIDGRKVTTVRPSCRTVNRAIWKVVDDGMDIPHAVDWAFREEREMTVRSIMKYRIEQDRVDRRMAAAE